MNDFIERRTDPHLQMLVEVGVRLCRLESQAHGRQFLESVHVPDSIIERVLAEATLHTAERRIRYVSYRTTPTFASTISADH